MNDKEKLKELLLELFKSGEVQVVTEKEWVVDWWRTETFLVIDGQKVPIRK